MKGRSLWFSYNFPSRVRLSLGLLLDFNVGFFKIPLFFLGTQTDVHNFLLSSNCHNTPVRQGRLEESDDPEVPQQALQQYVDLNLGLLGPRLA